MYKKKKYFTKTIDDKSYVVFDWLSRPSTVKNKSEIIISDDRHLTSRTIVIYTLDKKQSSNVLQWGNEAKEGSSSSSATVNEIYEKYKKYQEDSKKLNPEIDITNESIRK